MTLTRFDGAIVAFLATAKPDRALVFYRDVLGLPLVSDDAFALAFEVNGTQLRIQKVESLVPQRFTALGWSVSDIEAAADRLSTLGVAFERYSFLEQDDRGIWAAPSGARVAWFKDPDENLLSLSQHPG
jgi:catechol 2,3-dioxygenase-like lactoylglutathione lyase family enzyme